MKKKLALLLCLVLVVATFTSCTKELSVPHVPNEGIGDSITSEITADAVVEYGAAESILNNDGPLFAYILYPQSGGFADSAIFDWAMETYNESLREIEMLRDKDPYAGGEINVQFNSYLVDGKYAGISEKGVFMNTHLANPKEIVKTFNLDLEKGVFLEKSDIIDTAQTEDILYLLRGKILEAYPDSADLFDEMDESWLSNIVIVHGGVQVILTRGLYLPAYLGTLSLTLLKAELGAALNLEKKGRDKSLEEDYMRELITSPEQALQTDQTPPPGQASLPEQILQPGQTPSPEAVSPEQTQTPQQVLRESIDPAKPMVALTFDDGPSKFTSKVLDCLERNNARATFCVVGNMVGGREDVVARAFNMGNEVIGHTWDHRDLTKISSEKIRWEFSETNRVIKEITGVEPTMYRPPYGALNNNVKKISGETGMAIIYWSIDTLDWKTRNANAVYNAIMDKVSDREIILCHDLHGTTADAMERVIPDLISKGYQLVTVSELMQCSGKTLEAGKVYYSGK